jgi:hypothetical protein
LISKLAKSSGELILDIVVELLLFPNVGEDISVIIFHIIEHFLLIFLQGTFRIRIDITVCGSVQENYLFLNKDRYILTLFEELRQP